MSIETLERWARRDGLLQRATPHSKLLGAGLGLAGVLSTQKTWVLLLILLLWLSLLALSRLPVGRILLLAGYAFVFAGLYAFWEIGDWKILLPKATAAALVVLSLFTTTPYPQVFQPLQGILPKPLPDALLLTYRSFFILWHRWAHLYAAQRLRGGTHPHEPWRTAANLGSSFGALIVDALHHSQALYDAMLLRGWRGILTGAPLPFFNRWSWLPLAAGGLSVLGSRL